MEYRIIEHVNCAQYDRGMETFEDTPYVGARIEYGGTLHNIVDVIDVFKPSSIGKYCQETHVHIAKR